MSAPLEGDCDSALCLRTGVRQLNRVRMSAPLEGDCDNSYSLVRRDFAGPVRMSAPLEGDCTVAPVSMTSPSSGSPEESLPSWRRSCRAWSEGNTVPSRSCRSSFRRNRTPRLRTRFWCAPYATARPRWVATSGEPSRRSSSIAASHSVPPLGQLGHGPHREWRAEAGAPSPKPII